MMKKILFFIILIPSLLFGEPIFSDSAYLESVNENPITLKNNRENKSYTIPAIENIFFITSLWSYDRFVANEDWAIIGINSVETNFKNGHEWDHGGFVMNQIAHPYSGSIYFTSARSNDLSFVESAAYTFSGSLIWEFFMENHYPSINDMITTTFGGIALGEILYRLSNLCLVEGATGGEKIIRETFSALLSPMNSINRYFGNYTYKPENSNIHYNFSIGGNTQFVADKIDKMDSMVFAEFMLEYNEMFQDKSIRKPFDYFKIAIDLNLYNDNAISTISLLGHLVGREIDQDSYSVLIGAFQHYFYTNNDILRLSSSSIGPGLEVKSRLTEKINFKAGFHLQGILLGAMDSRYLEKIRDYNFGPGYAILSYMKFGRKDAIEISLTGKYFFFDNVVGIANSEQIWITNSSLDVPVYRNLRFGLEYNYFDRSEKYDEYADVSGYGDLLRTFLTISF